MTVIWIAGSKLAIRGKLTALQRSLIGESGVNDFYFFHYDGLKKQLQSYSINHKLNFNMTTDARRLIEVSIPQKRINCLMNAQTHSKELNKKRNVSHLRLMSLYANQHYADFFQLLYENRLTLDELPEEVHQPVENEWIIRTLSFEWKLRIILWLNKMPDKQVVTKRLVRSKINTMIKEEQLRIFRCPNITGNYYEIPVNEFLSLLISSNYLIPLKNSKWRVNND